jgi:hypothetical protein
MSLMAIILWALYPLSPWKRYYEYARHLLKTLLTHLNDQRWIDWLEACPDDPQGICLFERIIDDLNAGIDLLVYVRAREILGLPLGKWKRPTPSPPQRRRSSSLGELFSRLEACTLRFADIERLAQRRAQKLARLLSTNPDLLLRTGEGLCALNAQHADSGGGAPCLSAPPFEATAPPVLQQTFDAGMPADAFLPRSRKDACASFASTGSPVILIFYLTPARAGLRIRAPP